MKMVRQISPTDQELVEWSQKSGVPIVRTDVAIRIRNISLKDIVNLDSAFATKERSDLQLIQQKFSLQDWIPYFSFAMNRVLSDNARKNLILAQKTNKGKYITFYGESINQSSQDFIFQREQALKLCEDKEMLSVLDPAEMDFENLKKKAKHLISSGDKNFVLQYRDILKYSKGWQTLQQAIGNKMKWIVTDVTPKTATPNKYSTLLAPFFFSENIIVSHGRGRGFGAGTPEITWMNEHFACVKNKLLEQGVPKSKLLHYSRCYNINKAIEMTKSELQVPDISVLSSNIDGVGHFTQQLRAVNAR